MMESSGGTEIFRRPLPRQRKADNLPANAAGQANAEQEVTEITEEFFSVRSVSSC